MKQFPAVEIFSVNDKDVIKKKTDLTINYGFTETVWGTCFIATSSIGICMLQFPKQNDNPLEELKNKWEKATLTENISKIKKIAYIIFNQPSTKPIALYIKGTSFQINVWKCLLEVPFGSLVSYEELAINVGNIKAVRAVASAVAHNPISILIPCHRIIRKNGDIGNYRWGRELKSAFIEYEKNPNKLL